MSVIPTPLGQSSMSWITLPSEVRASVTEHEFCPHVATIILLWLQVRADTSRPPCGLLIIACGTLSFNLWINTLEVVLAIKCCFGCSRRLDYFIEEELATEGAVGY